MTARNPYVVSDCLYSQTCVLCGFVCLCLSLQSSEGDSYADMCQKDEDGVTCKSFGVTSIWDSDFDAYDVRASRLL